MQSCGTGPGFAAFGSAVAAGAGLCDTRGAAARRHWTTPSAAAPAIPAASTRIIQTGNLRGGAATGDGAQADPALVAGLTPPDDAAAYRVSDDLAVIGTVDFFPPLVDDPRTYGEIAAANALSDVFAMGGRVLFALSIAAFPEELPREVLAEVFAGASTKVREAGGTLAGGHTIRDPEPKYGLAVIGAAHPDRLLRKGGAKPGDVLVLGERREQLPDLEMVRRHGEQPGHRDARLAAEPLGGELVVHQGVEAPRVPAQRVARVAPVDAEHARAPETREDHGSLSGRASSRKRIRSESRYPV